MRRTIATLCQAHLLGSFLVGVFVLQSRPASAQCFAYDVYPDCIGPLCFAIVDSDRPSRETIYLDNFGDDGCHWDVNTGGGWFQGEVEGFLNPRTLDETNVSLTVFAPNPRCQPRIGQLFFDAQRLLGLLQPGRPLTRQPDGSLACDDPNLGDQPPPPKYYAPIHRAVGGVKG
jgi:hypothetical protein